MVKAKALRRVVAFTCTGNQTRCVMAAGFAIKYLPGVPVVLAALPPVANTRENLQEGKWAGVPHSLVAQVMKEVGIDISSMPYVVFDENLMNTITHIVFIARGEQNSHVISAIGRHRRRVPIQVRDWHIEEPAPHLAALRQARAEIEWRVRVLQKELEVADLPDSDMGVHRWTPIAFTGEQHARCESR
ncbi:MAG: hypothetical protein JW839_04095 [Candidatus Lokiarchaeota archaeon]|nr:hypothetical protein [Candidatus Lokiarchaeota archaeon]